MPINFGLKANQPPNYLKGKMVSRIDICTISITKVKTHAGGRKSQPALHRSIFMSAGQEIGTQSRPCFGLGRYG